jgi:hypothetical protein
MGEASTRLRSFFPSQEHLARKKRNRMIKTAEHPKFDSQLGSCLPHLGQNLASGATSFLQYEHIGITHLLLEN